MVNYHVACLKQINQREHLCMTTINLAYTIKAGILKLHETFAWSIGDRWVVKEGDKEDVSQNGERVEVRTSVLTYHTRRERCHIKAFGCDEVFGQDDHIQQPGNTANALVSSNMIYNDVCVIVCHHCGI